MLGERQLPHYILAYEQTLAPRAKTAILDDGCNAQAGAIHSKAMPVILIQADQVEAGVTMSVTEALLMQKLLHDGVENCRAR